MSICRFKDKKKAMMMIFKYLLFLVIVELRFKHRLGLGLENSLFFYLFSELHWKDQKKLTIKISYSKPLHSQYTQYCRVLVELFWVFVDYCYQELTRTQKYPRGLTKGCFSRGKYKLYRAIKKCHIKSAGFSWHVFKELCINL